MRYFTTGAGADDGATVAICGAETCGDFADFAADREALFRSFLKLANDLPGHDTFSRLFRLVHPAAFSACFGRFVDALGQRARGFWRSTPSRCGGRSTRQRAHCV